jgi:hypothetical protein
MEGGEKGDIFSLSLCSRIPQEECGVVRSASNHGK